MALRADLEKQVEWLTTGPLGRVGYYRRPNNKRLPAKEFLEKECHQDKKGKFRGQFHALVNEQGASWQLP